MSRIPYFTMSEAGYVLGRSRATLSRAIDRGIIQASLEKNGKASKRVLGWAELRFLRIADELDKDLTPGGRRRLYMALRILPHDVHKLLLGHLELNLTKIDLDLEDRMAKLEAIRGRIDDESDCEDPVIRGTAFVVHIIAALARHQGVDAVIKDFPVTREQVEAAVEYAIAYPRRGRPFPTKRLKTKLAALVGSGSIGRRDDGEV